MIHLTKDSAIALLEAVIEESPEGGATVYQRKSGGACLYIHDEKPDCLIGKALHKAGVALSDLAKHGDRGNGYGAAASAGKLLVNLRAAGVLTYDNDAEQAFNRAQNAQDGGRTWGEALENAQTGTTLTFALGT